MKKDEVKQFMLWCFDEKRRDEIRLWSSAQIAREYKKDTNIDVEVSFIRKARERWFMFNGQLFKIEVFERMYSWLKSRNYYDCQNTDCRHYISQIQ